MKTRKPPAGWRYVVPTKDEVAEWRTLHDSPMKYNRVQCKLCGKRIWATGLGCGAHRRSCHV